MSGEQEARALRLADEPALRSFEQEYLSRARRDSRSKAASTLALRLAALGVILALWSVASGHWIDPRSISDPVSVLSALIGLFASGRVWGDLTTTAMEVVAGFVFGCSTGIALAVAFAFSAELKQIANPFILAFYAIPKVALAPLMVMWFGLGLEPKIVLAAIFSFFVTFVNAEAGSETVNPALLRIVSVMGMSHGSIVRKVLLPSMAPFVFIGIRLALPEALIGAAIGEFIAADSGLAYLVNTASEQSDMAVAFAAILIMLAFVTIADWLIGRLESACLPWRPKVQTAIRA